ncbi:MAG: ABC transporter permease [Pseudomonadota bacterium]
MDRLRFLLRRVGRFAVSLFALFALTFLLVHFVPGDPVRASLGLLAPQELVEARRQELGLDRPLPEQFARHVAALARGDLGTSLSVRRPVSEVIAERLPATLALAGGAMLIVVLAGTGLGLAAAAVGAGGRRPGADMAFNATSGLLTSTPEFVTAVALTSLFAVALSWAPVAGRGGAASYVLPTLALALGPAAALARVVRTEGLRVLEEDYMRAARARRLSAWRLYAVHALPNCLTAALTVSGLILGGLVAGTVLVENVFAWPGLGSAIVTAITQKDYPLTQGVILVLGALVLLINFGVDVLITWLDPRSALARH